MSKFLNKSIQNFCIKSIIIAVTLCSIVISKVSAQENFKAVKIENLRYEWLVYSQDSKELIPYVEEFNSKSTSLHLILDLNKYKEHHLVLDIPDNTSLLIQNQLVEYYSFSRTVTLSIDSLITSYQLDEVQISVFSEQDLTKEFQTNILDIDPLNILEENASIMKNESRKSNLYQDFNIISIFIIVILVIVVRSFRSAIFNEYFSAVKIFSLKPKSEVLYAMSVLSTTNLLYILLYGVITGFTFVNIMTWFSSEKLANLGYESYSSVILLSFLASVAAVVFMLLKYVVIKIISRIFLFRKVSFAHFQEYLRFSFIISIMLFIVFIISQIPETILKVEHLFYLQVLFIIRALFIYIKLNNLQSFSKLQLFTYLCGTEFIPLVILLNIFNNYIGVF